MKSKFDKMISDQFLFLQPILFNFHVKMAPGTTEGAENFGGYVQKWPMPQATALHGPCPRTAQCVVGH